jgi:hypothetical protein
MKQERANFIAHIMLERGANEFHGISVNDILDMIDIPRQSLYRILDLPGFKKCKAVKYPQEYWFDANARSSHVGKVAKPEVELPPYDGKQFIDRLKTSSNGLLITHDQIKELKHDEKNKFHSHLDNLEKFAWNLLTRVQQTKDHPLYDTPEWWRIYNDVEN